MILDQIIETKKEEVALLKKATTVSTLMGVITGLAFCARISSSTPFRFTKRGLSARMRFC